ncbi:MAG: hypothetical protein GW939_02695, partial [Candidatus Magasanikbacteria bacterium]|nr:hypothetical protein [Candidatus Magasanikbacteria bacterium]
LQDTGSINNDFEIKLSSTENALNIHHTNTGEDYVTVTSAGNVGIGSASPGSKLDVNGDIRASQTGGRFQASGDGTGYSGTLGSAQHTDAAGLSYRTYWAYDSYWNETTNQWNANRTTLGNKWMADMGYHQNSFRIRRFDGTVSSPWADSDWTNLFVVNSSGNITSGTYNAQTISSAASFTGTVNAVTGYKVNGAATTGNYLRGNGTNFVSSAIQAGDLPTITAAGGWTDDGSVVRLTTSANNVGIGTTNAPSKLYVAGNTVIFDATTPHLELRRSESNGGLAYAMVEPRTVVPSRLTAAEIGYTVGSTLFPNVKGGATGCVGPVTYAAAVAYADSIGARLPTIEELEADVMAGTGCSFDARIVWTQTKAGIGQRWVNYGKPSNYTATRVALDETSTAYIRLVAEVDHGYLGEVPAIIDSSGYLRASSIRARTSTGISLYDDGGNGIFVQDGGNVGIGSTSPGYKLDINTTGVGVRIAGLGSGNTGLRMESTSGNSPFLSFNNGSQSFSLRSDANVLNIGEGDSGGFTNMLSIQKTSGNVGIGTTSPQTQLHTYKGSLGANTGITDVLRIELNRTDHDVTPSGPAILFKDQDTNNGTNEARIKMMTVNDTDFGDNDEAASNLIFETTNGGTASDKMIITGRGNIGINTLNPGALLHVNGDFKLQTGTNVNNIATTVGVTGDDNTLVTEQGIREALTALSTGGGVWTDGGTYVYPTDAGNYGSTGLQITDAGNLSMNGSLVVDGDATITGTLNANNGLVIDGNTVIDNGGGWHRSYGATGWYSQTYGGGWYMTDSSYIRNYNSKALYINGNGTDSAVFMSGNVGIGTTAPSQALEIKGGFLATPGTPVIAGNTAADAINMDGPEGIFVQGKYAYVASYTSDSLSIIDISVPSNPVRISTITNATTLNGANYVVTNGNYAYVAAAVGDRITVVDVSNPSAPSVVGTVTSNTQLDDLRNMTISGKYLYAAARTDDRITAVDISDPTNPFIVGSSPGDTTDTNDPWGIAVQGKYAYLAVRYDSANLTSGSRLTI